MMTMASFLPLFTLLKVNDRIEYRQIDLPEQQTILHWKALNIALHWLIQVEVEGHVGLHTTHEKYKVYRKSPP